MSSPIFFSILLPTKNRSHLVGQAIESVLNQTFGDYELLIADNDDDMYATKNVVSSFDDSRIQYIRTGKLSMVENWEVARKQANGQFLTVLEDKQSYSKFTLESLHDLIISKSAEVVTWKVNFSTKLKKPHNQYVPPDHFKPINSEHILSSYIKGRRVWNYLPRSINSCASKKLIDKIAELTKDTTFYNYYSPDLVSAFKQLFATNTIYYSNKRLTVITSNESNGFLNSTNKKASEKYFSGAEIIDESIAIKNVPIKNSSITSNSVYSDYLGVKQQFGVENKSLIMSQSTYAFMCYKDIDGFKKHGGKEIYLSKKESLDYYVENIMSAGERRKYFRKILFRKLKGK